MYILDLHSRPIELRLHGLAIIVHCKSKQLINNLKKCKHFTFTQQCKINQAYPRAKPHGFWCEIGSKEAFKRQ